MTWWDIKPQGVQSQLQLTAAKAEGLGKALEAMAADLRAAGQAAGTAVPGSAARTQVPGPWKSGPVRSIGATGPVAAAIEQYLDKRAKEFASMAEHVQACVLGASKATRAYVEGDLATAKRAQDAARAVRLDILKGIRGKK